MSGSNAAVFLGNFAQQHAQAATLHGLVQQLASITGAKRQRILRAARHYLSGRPEVPCRFDVILLDALDPERIEWLKDAFGE